MAKATAFSIQPTDDFAIVRDLAHRIWPASYAHFLTPDQISNMLASIYDIDALRAEAGSGHRFFLATINQGPVGYASAYTEQGIAWLKKLYLLPECRGIGLGSALLAAALAPFADAREQRLYVNSRNDTARRFYEREGFQQVDTASVMMGDYRFCDCVYRRLR